MNIISMTPITASQFGTNRLVQGLLKGSGDAELTGAQKFGSAMVAGAASAFIASPSELVIIHQQVHCRCCHPVLAVAPVERLECTSGVPASPLSAHRKAGGLWRKKPAHSSENMEPWRCGEAW